MLFALVIMGGVSPGTLRAQSAQPLSNFLRPDGTIDLAKGFAGTLDPHGYKMSLTPSGVPRFLAAASVAADDQSFGGHDGIMGCWTS